MSIVSKAVGGVVHGVQGAVKGVRKTLHLPPITAGNVLTKYAPAALALGAGGPLATAAAKIPGGAAVLKAGGVLNGAKRAISIPGFAGGAMPGPASGGAPAAGGDQNWMQELLGGIGGLAKKAIANPMNTALGGLAVAQGVNAAKASARQGKLSDEAIALAKARYAAQAPLRAKGISQMLNPGHANLSDVYTDPTNPFAVKRPLSPASATIAPVATPTRPAVPRPKFGTTGPIASQRRLLTPPAVLKRLGAG